MNKDLIEKDEWLSQEDKVIIRKQFFPPSATDDDMKYCMGVAKAFKLNPILKQIYFVPRRSKVDGKWIEKVEPLAGRDSFLTLAHRSGKFNGIETTVDIKAVPTLENGKWDIKDDLVATCKVWVKGMDNPFVVEVNYSEYVQKTSAGEITKFYNDKPITMIKKVAESQCLRKAFDITGLYDESELRNDNIIETEISKTKEVENKKNMNDL